MDACKMQLAYCGTKVNLEFKNGNHLNGKRATLITSNPFVQDAIESSPKFGVHIILAETYDIASASKESEAAMEKEEARPALLRGKRKLKTQAQIDSEKSKAVAGQTVVEDVKNVNDAIAYFSKLGESVESEESLELLKEKHGVVFPNLKV